MTLEQVQLEFEMPDPGDDIHQLVGDYILFTSADNDPFAENPCESWDGIGRIRSFSNRHANYWKGDPLEALGRWRCPECGADEEHIYFDFGWYGDDNELEQWVMSCGYCEFQTPTDKKPEWWEDFHDRIPLGYFEHGNCIWHVTGEIPLGTEGDYRWDGTRFAGFWEPDDSLLDLADQEGLELGSHERRKKMEQWAREACETYTNWCNGWVFCYAVIAYTAKLPYDRLIDYRHDAEEFHDACCGFYDWDHFKGEVEDAWKRAVKHLSES